jgi:hypothetical protein
MKVQTQELLPISRFARLTGPTVKTLRHYDAGACCNRPA